MALLFLYDDDDDDVPAVKLGVINMGELCSALAKIINPLREGCHLGEAECSSV